MFGSLQALMKEQLVSINLNQVPSYLIAHVFAIKCAEFSQVHEISLVVMGVIDGWLDFETPVQALKRLKARYLSLKL